MVRRLSPGLYKLAVLARRGRITKLALRLPYRLRAWQIFRRGKPIVVEVSELMGLGGMLSNAGYALMLGEDRNTPVSISFTCALYSPAGFEGSDYLESYFDRVGPRYAVGAICQSQDLPGSRKDLSPQHLAPLLWGNIRIREEFRRQAADFIPTHAFASVHYRGSDKFLEAPRTEAKRVLDVVAREMESAGLLDLFVATDEPEFLRLAISRFGGRVFTMPLEAVASADGTPAHFSTVGGEIKAREALITMLVLASSALMVKTESLLSDWAATMTDCQRVVLVSGR